MEGDEHQEVEREVALEVSKGYLNELPYRQRVALFAVIGNEALYHGKNEHDEEEDVCADVSIVYLTSVPILEPKKSKFGIEEAGKERKDANKDIPRHAVLVLIVYNDVL